jgi:hypothetical protein
VAGGGPVAGSRSPSVAPNLKEAGADGILASPIPSPAARWIPGKPHAKRMEGWIPSPGVGGLIRRLGEVGTHLPLTVSVDQAVKQFFDESPPWRHMDGLTDGYT